MPHIVLMLDVRMLCFYKVFYLWMSVGSQDVDVESIVTNFCKHLWRPAFSIACELGTSKHWTSWKSITTPVFSSMTVYEPYLAENPELSQRPSPDTLGDFLPSLQILFLDEFSKPQQQQGINRHLEFDITQNVIKFAS